MLTEEAFLRLILDGVPPDRQRSSGGMVEGFDSFETDAPSADSPPPPFARFLLENSGFGDPQSVPRDELLIGEPLTARFLPDRVAYWPKTESQPFHILFFELPTSGRTLLADPFFNETDQLEDALHRMIQDALHGFEHGGVARTSERLRGMQEETLCVVSILDDRGARVAGEIVCFGTKCEETEALESFCLREEVRDWDRPLAEEHLSQFYHRHYRKLTHPGNWQDAFVSAPERSRASALVEACKELEEVQNNPTQLKEALFLLLDELALSFGIPRSAKFRNGNACLKMEDLPPHHGIAEAPEVARRRDFINPMKGVRIFDSGNRLLGYLVYLPDPTMDRAWVRSRLQAHNHFHNVLVIYPDDTEPEIEIWQGTRPLRGKLRQGGARSRFEGLGGIIQLLARFFVVSKSAIESPDQLARELAWRAQHLRAIALDELSREIEQDDGPLFRLYRDFNRALVHQTPEDFADTYAQTITYGLLAARWLAKDSLRRFSRKEAGGLLPSTSEFLRVLFERLISEDYDSNLAWLIDDIASLLSRTLVGEVFEGERDPSIHFYQDFLDAYDSSIRRRMGVYYTPDEVVRYMVRTLDHLARTRLGLRLGLADPIRWGAYAADRGIDVPPGVSESDFVVQILDPAVGTGTFLLHTLSRIFQTMVAEYDRLGLDEEAAASAWKQYVSESLLPRLNGFELMMAPYIVSHLRLGLALERGLAAESGRTPSLWGFTFDGDDRLNVFLTNTLALQTGPQLDWMSPHVADEARLAESVKRNAPILVILGNPPYERVAADSDDTAQWILRGEVPGRETSQSLFAEILDVAKRHVRFSYHASLYDRYVYFWRWAIWKALERPGMPGLLSFITNSTWLTGQGFLGLRELARRHAEEIWGIDLGGDNRGSNRDPNVFNIETPVAIATLVRLPSTTTETPAQARFQAVGGESAQEKLVTIEALPASFETTEPVWHEVGSGWFDALRPPAGGEDWASMPELGALFPWQLPGCKYGRTWPISPSRRMIEARWARFLSAKPAEDRAAMFVTARTGRNIHTRVRGFPRLVDLPAGTPPQPIVRYGYRSFDRQWALQDPRVTELERPALWQSHSDRQVFLVTMITKQLSAGPAMTSSAVVPDLDYFSGRGGRDIIPLYRDRSATVPNVTTGLLETLGRKLGLPTPTPEDLAAYVYALLSARRYEERFRAPLKVPSPRVPMTAEASLWLEAVETGKYLLWLHTYGERFSSPEAGRGPNLPTIPGLAWKRPVEAMPQSARDIAYDPSAMELRVGDGLVTGVRSDVMDFAVSGMKVVSKWLGYRTARGAGRAATSQNPLDRLRETEWPQDWSEELLDLLSVLTKTLDLQGELAGLVDAIADGELIAADELPVPTADDRKEPNLPRPNLTGRLL